MRRDEPIDPDPGPAGPFVVVAVSAGGGLGAAARWLADQSVPGVGTTVAVNLVGCALLGALVVLVTEAWTAHPLARPFLGTGVLGGFTTFSAYALDLADLVDRGDHAMAAGYAAGTLAGCLVVTAAAVVLTRSAIARSGVR